MAACGEMLSCPSFKSSKRCTGKEGQCSQSARAASSSRHTWAGIKQPFLESSTWRDGKHDQKARIRNLSSTTFVHKVVETCHKLEKDKGLQEAPRSMCVHKDIGLYKK